MILLACLLLPWCYIAIIMLILRWHKGPVRWEGKNL